MGSAYNSVDAPLWFFWTLQALEKHVGADEIWKSYGHAMKDVLALSAAASATTSAYTTTC